MIAGNLFTRHYLLEGITRSEPWTALADGEVASLKASLLKHAKKLLSVSKPNEAQPTGGREYACDRCSKG